MEGKAEGDLQIKVLVEPCPEIDARTSNGTKIH